MTKTTFQKLLPLLFLILMVSFSAKGQETSGNVKVSGAMKNVMWKGELYGTIDLDTIPDKKDLYGLGPAEFLSGELLVIDGVSYRSFVKADGSVAISQTFNSKAPFFVYANVSKWEERYLPDSIRNIHQLESYLDRESRNLPQPFVFRLKGTVESATIHIVNLPEGTKVSSPEEAHLGQKNYHLKNKEAEIVGFFSTRHQSIFTHHDTFLHMHLITEDRTQMGHLDRLEFGKGKIRLFLSN